MNVAVVQVFLPIAPRSRIVRGLNVRHDRCRWRSELGVERGGVGAGVVGEVGWGGDGHFEPGAVGLGLDRGVARRGGSYDGIFDDPYLRAHAAELVAAN